MSPLFRSTELHFPACAQAPHQLSLDSLQILMRMLGQTPIDQVQLHCHPDTHKWNRSL